MGVAGALNVTGAAALASTLLVQGKITGNNGADIQGQLGTNSLSVTGTSTLTGNVNAQANLAVGGNVTVAGNLTVAGNTTVINTTSLTVNDAFVRVASGNSTSDAINSGIYSEYSTDGKASLYSGLVRVPGAESVWKLFKDASSMDANSDPNDFSVLADLEVNSVCSLSDQRLKNNVELIDAPLERLDKLRGVTYNWIDEKRGTERVCGVIAQEAQAALPQLVRETNEGFLSVDYARISCLLIECVKQLKADNADLRGRLAALENRQ
jgi:hypothetical protein